MSKKPSRSWVKFFFAEWLVYLAVLAITGLVVHGSRSEIVNWYHSFDGTTQYIILGLVVLALVMGFGLKHARKPITPIAAGLAIAGVIMYISNSVEVDWWYGAQFAGPWLFFYAMVLIPARLVKYGADYKPSKVAKA